MKRCPQCNATYDEHVEFCFVDGASLVHMDEAELQPVAPPPSRPKIGIGTVLGGSALAVLLLALIAFGLVFQRSTRADDGSIEPAPAPVMMVEETRSNDPYEGDGSVALISISSEPPGASVWEGRAKVCESTPCTIEHPPHAPVPRLFSVRLSDHKDWEVTMWDPDRPIAVELERNRRRNSRRRRNNGGAPIMLER